MPLQNMKNNRLRLPAEWEPQDAIILAWPHAHTDWAYMLDEVRQCFYNIIKAILNEGERVVVLHENIDDDRLAEIKRCGAILVETQFNDTWARDTCPITLLDEEGEATFCDFMFNGWGLKFASDRDNLINRSLYNKHLLQGTYANYLNFVLEGGSIESDGKGTILTSAECLLSPNRNGGSSKEDIEIYLLNTFGAKKMLWINHGYLEGDDTDSHIDTLARLAPDDTILYVKCSDKADPHFSELAEMEKELKEMLTLEDKPFRLLPLPMPNKIVDEEGLRLPATYANFLIGNGFVLVPTYNHKETDEEALATIGKAFPDRRIIGIDCRALIKQHGSLHCVTMQLPQNTLNIDE